MKNKLILSLVLAVIIAATTGVVFASKDRAKEPASGVIDADRITIRAPIIMPPIGKLAVIKPSAALRNKPNNVNAGNPLKPVSPPGFRPLGTMLKLYVTDGKKIKKGELLAELDPKLYRAALKIADSRLLAAKASLNSINDKIADLTGNLDKVDKNLTKMKQAGESSLPPAAGNQKATVSLNAKMAALAKSKIKLEDTKTQLSSALSKLETTEIQAQKGLALAKLGRDAANENLKRLKIYAPASGYVSLVHVNAGEVIYPNQTLVDIYQSGHVKMKIYLPLTRAKNIRLMQNAEVVVDSFPNKKFSAKVTRVSPEVQFAPSTLPTRLTHLLNVQEISLRVSDRDGILKPGMPADSFIKEN